MRDYKKKQNKQTKKKWREAQQKINIKPKALNRSSTEKQRGK